MFVRNMSAYEKEEVRSRVESLEEVHMTGLKDWAAIRAHLKRHDNEMIKDCEDDINTMLVFAGLFSAIVTAFIIESYQWLEQDDDQLSTQLLAQISSQLAGSPINQTLIDAADSHISFIASLSSIWINILWALSLLFSLTAALAGIIIKQWLREYLLWDSVLSPPREAVLLRHIRYDAWEKWKVPEIISTIPAMLEFALVLFLCGAVTLLWTLNSAVAIVVTIFGVIFFLLACAANFLPIFFHRCPYKSATGWICVSVWDLVCRWYVSVRERYRSLPHTSHRHSADWRQRDLQRHRQWDLKIDWNPHLDMKKDTRLETVELIILFHALAWVCTRTQDDRLLEKVQQCARNFHGSNKKHLCLIAGIYATCQILSLDANTFFASLQGDFIREPLEGNEYGLYTLQLHKHLRSKHLWQGREPDVTSESIRMVGDVLLNVARIFIQELFPTTPHSSSPSAKEMQTFMEALSFLVHIVALVPRVSWRENLAAMLIDLYHKLTGAEVAGPWIVSKEMTGPRYPGFKAPVLQLLTHMSSVEMTPTGDLSIISSESASTPAELIQLAVQLFRNNPHYVRKEDRHTFLIIADTALRKSILADDLVVDRDAVLELLLCIDDASRLSINLHLPNLGFHCQFPPLLDTLVWFAERRNPVSVHLIPASLVEHLEGNIGADLLPGEQSPHLVERLRTLVAARRSSHLKWNSDATAIFESPKSDHAVALPEHAALDRGKLVMDPRKMSSNIDHASSSPSPSIPTPYFPPTPFSMINSGDADLELGTVSYDFPSPQIPNLPFVSHSRTPTWPR